MKMFAMNSLCAEAATAGDQRCTTSSLACRVGPSSPHASALCLVLLFLIPLTVNAQSAQSISSVSPNSIGAGNPDFTITVTGSGFTNSSMVYWSDAYIPPTGSATFYGNAVSLATTVVSATQLQALVPASLVGSARHNYGVLSLASVVQGPPYVTVQIILPSLISVSPQPVYEGANNIITINGSAFIPGSTVIVDWQSSTASYSLPLTTTYVNASSITAIFPATFIENPGGAYTVSVANCYNPQPPAGVTYTTCSSPGLALSVVPVPTVNLSGTTPTTGLPNYVQWLPDARPSVPYSFTFSGSNGKPPYTWSTPSPQFLPHGLSLSSNGVLAGTPLQQETDVVQLTLTDSNGVTASAGFGLAVGPIGVSFSSVSSGQVGTPFGSGGILLGSYGGHLPLAWNVVSGALPPGLSLIAPWVTSFIGYQEAVVSGTPTTAGAYPVTFRVSDASGTSSIGTMTMTITGPVPAVTFTGPMASAPGSQPTLTFKLGQAYPLSLTGTFTLTVEPAAQTGVDDPNIQFSTGGRTLSVTIPSGSTTTPLIQFQAGTVAASITITLQLTANGVNVTPSDLQPVVVQIPAASPSITSGTLTRDGNTLTVSVRGYSSPREMAQATFTFSAASGETISNPTISIPVASAFSTWFQSGQSDQYGSSFTFTQSFTISQDPSAISSVSVTLSNSVGASNVQVVQ
jgi:hypothetical protein